MNRYVPIAFSAIFLLITFLPCQVLAAGITETKAAIGKGCVASGTNSIAMGYFTTASGDYSTAIGHNTKTDGLYSFAGGKHMQLTSTADHTFVLGVF